MNERVFFAFKKQEQKFEGWEMQMLPAFYYYIF